MTAGTFSERIAQLREQVGVLTTGFVNVDQVYAHYQDSGVGPHGKPAAAFDHPDGGEAGYLSDTMTDYGPQWAQAVADSISEETPMADVFIDAVQDIGLEVEALAPLEFGNLRESSERQVEHDGEVVFDSPPLIPRLSDEELKQLGKLSKWKYNGAGFKTTTLSAAAP